MKKIIFILLLSVSVYACGGCVDNGLGASLGQQSIAQFNNLDEQTSRAIEKVIDKIHKAHQELEQQNKDILIQTQKIIEAQAQSEQEINYNQNIINELQSIINSKNAEKRF